MQPFPYIGEIASLSAAMVWAFSLTLFSKFGRNLKAPALNLFKNTVALVCFGAMLLVSRPELPETWESVSALALSGVLGLALGDTALFIALQRLGPQNTAVSQCIVPLLTAIIALSFLGESLNIFELFGMFLTLGAVMLVLLHDRRVTFQELTNKQIAAGLGFAAIAALCQSTSVVIIRNYLQDTDLILGTSLRLLPAFLVLAIVGLKRGYFSDILGQVKTSPKSAGILVMAATLGTFVGLILMSTGAKYTKAGVSSALTSTFPLWIIPISAVIAQEKVSLKKSLLTIVAVVGVGIMMLN